MRKVDADARSDDVPGRAVVLFHGITELSEVGAFFLRLRGTSAGAPEVQDLQDEQWPMSAHVIDEGLELVIGPELALHWALVPGTPVEIELPDAQIWSEIIWPAVQPLKRARPRIFAAHSPDTKTAGAIASERGGDTEPAMPQLKKNDGQSPVPIEDAALDVRRAAPDVSFLNYSNEAHPEEPEAMADVPTDLQPTKSSELDYSAHKEPNDYVTFYPHARGGKLGTTSAGGSKSLMPTTRLGAAALAVAGVLALQGMLWIGAGGQAPGYMALVSGSAGGDSASSAMLEILASGPVSPRGVQARETAPIRALENAQAALMTPGTPRDSEEASYWLRRYVASGGSDERMRRALTQLGSTFADQTNRQADFGKARQLWELASAMGDSVAMCFLGTLHENALAGPADRRVALAWFERAKLSGGCSNVDDAIARLRQ